VCRKEEGAKKREEWVKNWVARKYNKPKFPRGPVPILSGPQVLQ
jgi:disulfide oxidoreductase YuzD